MLNTNWPDIVAGGIFSYNILSSGMLIILWLWHCWKLGMSLHLVQTPVYTLQ